MSPNSVHADFTTAGLSFWFLARADSFAKHGSMSRAVAIVTRLYCIPAGSMAMWSGSTRASNSLDHSVLLKARTNRSLDLSRLAQGTSGAQAQFAGGKMAQ